MGCDSPTVIKTYQKERVVIRTSGGPGPKGDKGDTGSTGAQGDQGPQGLQGATGPAGVGAIVASGAIQYDPQTGVLSLDPNQVSVNGGFY